MKDQIATVVSRTRRWKFEAGTTEIALGVIFSSAGAALLLPKSPTFYLSIFIIGIVLAGLLVEYLQHRYIFPRIGYIEYRIGPRKGIWRPFLVLAFSLVLVVGMFLLNHFVQDTLLPPAWFVPALAFLVGFALILYALLVKQKRFLLLGLISMSTGLLLALFGLGRVLIFDTLGILRLGFYFVTMGVCSLFSGFYALRAFLRSTPAPTESPDEH